MKHKRVLPFSALLFCENVSVVYHVRRRVAPIQHRYTHFHIFYRQN